MSSYEEGLRDRFAHVLAERSGREYVRVSFDRSGRERSQDDQHNENVTAVKNIGVTLRDGYREKGSASASRYATKARVVFSQLISDLEADLFGADVLVLWESSRGSREVKEWVTLVDLCVKRNVTIFVTTHGREYDPKNGRDRRSLLEDAVDSEYESSKTSDRATRAALSGALAGAPHGPVPYGYMRVYDPLTRKLIKQQPHPDEADVIRELFERLKAGHSLKAIARDFEARGIRNHSDRPFVPAHLRTMATTASYAGIRMHSPSGKQGRRVIPGQPVVEAQWEAIVKRADFLAVQAILTDPKRLVSRPGRGIHFVSMIALCDVCGGVLAVTQRKGFPEYQCHVGGHVRCRQEELDGYATDAILGYLAREDIYDEFTHDQGEDTPQLDQIRTELAEVTGELKKLRAKVAARKMSVDSLAAIEPVMMDDIEKLGRQKDALTTPSELFGLIEPGPDVAARWESVPMSTRRAVARLVLTPERLGELRVKPRPLAERYLKLHVRSRIRWVQTPSDQT